MTTDLETAAHTALEALKAVDLARYTDAGSDWARATELSGAAIAALEAALDAPVADRAPSFLADFARYRTDRPFDVRESVCSSFGTEEPVYVDDHAGERGGRTVAEPWPKTEDGLYDMSLGTMLRFTRLQALEEAAQVALRCAASCDADCRWLQDYITAAIRALAEKEPTDG